MALKDLFFTIFAKDKTGDAFASVAKRMRETEGHAASMSERINRAGRAMRNLGAAGSVASAGIASAFRGSIDLYDTQAKAEAKVAQAIKATGGAAGFTADQLKAQAAELQGLTRFGDEDILNKVTAQLLTFKNISGATFTDAQKAALDLATTLDGDLQSASIMLGKALNDPVAGLSAMSRAGVTFSEDQKEVIKALAQTGRVAEAQRMILDEIASAYGGQAEAAAKAGAGVVDQFNNTWGDVKEVVGAVLLDGLKAVLPPLKALAEAFQNMNPTAQRFVVIAGAMAVALPPLVATLGLLVLGLGAVSAPVLAVGAAIGVATAAVVAFWPQIQAMGKVVAKVFGAIPGIITGTVAAVVDAIRGQFGPIMDYIGEKVEWVEGKFAWLYDRVVGNSWVPDMVDEIGQNFARLEGNMVTPTLDGVGAVDASFKGLVDGVVGSLKGLAREGDLTWRGFLGSMHDAADRQVDAIIDQAFDRLGEAATDALSGAFSGAMGGGAGGGGGGFLSGIATAARGLLGFDTGGAFTVRGRAGTDRNVASVRLSEGENVEVTRRGQSARAVNVTMNVYTQDADSFRRSRAQIAGDARRMLAQAERGA